MMNTIVLPAETHIKHILYMREEKIHIVCVCPHISVQCTRFNAKVQNIFTKKISIIDCLVQHENYIEIKRQRQTEPQERKETEMRLTCCARYKNNTTTTTTDDSFDMSWNAQISTSFWNCKRIPLGKIKRYLLICTMCLGLLVRTMSADFICLTHHRQCLAFIF